MAQKPSKEETQKRKDERLSADIDRGRKKIVVDGPEPEIKEKGDEEADS